MQKQFHAVRVDKDGLPRLHADRAALIYCNHPSWWDAALFIVLSDRLMADRIAFGAMAETSLRRYPFMSKIGVFGVEHGTYRSAAAFLRTGHAILRNPKTLLWMNAEGTFTDPRTRPVGLQRGAAHLAAQLTDIDVIPMAIEYTFWNERFPEALCRFGKPVASAEATSVNSWQDLLQEKLTATMDILAAKAMTRDPAHFDLVLKGRTGIGGVYDAWRRGKATLRGEKFIAEHGTPDP